MSIGKNISNEIRKFHEGFDGTSPVKSSKPDTPSKTAKEETPPSKPAKKDKRSKK